MEQNISHNIKSNQTISFSLLKRVSFYYFTFAFLLTILQIFIEYYNIKNKIKDHVKDIQTNFRESLSNSLWEFNDIQTNSLLRGIVKSPIISRVEILSPENLILYEFTDDKKNRAYDVLNNTKPFVFSQELTKILQNKKTEKIGTLVIYSSKNVILNELSTLMEYILINSIIKTLFLWVILILVFNKNLKAPLEKFVKDISKINPQKANKLSFNEDDNIEEFYKIKSSINYLIEELNSYKGVLEALIQNKTELLEAKSAEVQKLLKDLKGAQKLIIQQEKLSALGVLSAGISHELKNPLNISINSSIMLKEIINDSDLSEVTKNEILPVLKIIINNNKRMNSIIHSMLLQSRTSKDPLQKVRIKSLIETNFKIIKTNYSKKFKEISSSINIDNDLEINIYLSDFARLIINILENSFQSLEEKSNTENFTPEINISTKTSGNTLSLIFYDNGKGIEKKHLDKVFDPFFTTKSIGQGTGLGLYLNEEIIKKHNGRIEIETEENKYCKVIVNIPLS